MNVWSCAVLILKESEMTKNKTIAVLGASTDRNKFGNKCVRAYLHAGWTVYPVNPREQMIEGQRVLADLAAVPQPLERISVYLPPAVGRNLLEAMAATGAREVFFNPGSASAELLSQAVAKGVPAIEDCSIVDIGLSPAQFP
jgi:uncharacterized protein